jgi:hypothetical protein
VVAAAEHSACVAALTTDSEVEDCRAAGKLEDYLTCFPACLDSVGLSAADYDPGDLSSSPVANCRFGCSDTTCAP